MVKTGRWSNIPEADRDAMYSDVGGKLLTGRIAEAFFIPAARQLHNRTNSGADGGGVLV